METSDGVEAPGMLGCADCRDWLDHGLAVRRWRSPPTPTVGFPKHPDEHCPERSILFAVDQELGEGAALWVAPELADPLGPFEIGQQSGSGGVGA